MSSNRAQRLVLKLDGKEVKGLYLSRLTYTEAIGELDGMTALLKIPKGAIFDDWKSKLLVVV